MGHVYRARDPRLGRDVAIKVLVESLSQDEEAVTRFQREARAVAALSHPNVLSIFDISTGDGTPYAVMELLEGETLADRLERSPLERNDALEVATATAEGLAAAHARGIVHRDLKPANIFLTSNGQVKILDFGLARLESSSPFSIEEGGDTVLVQTQPGIILGTVAYMSPEQARGYAVDARSDVFSFGCVLYEMLSGKRPFVGRTHTDTMVAILHGQPQDLGADACPPQLRQIVERCLAKEPERRFSSGVELLAVLRALSRAARSPESGHETEAVPAAAEPKEQSGKKPPPSVAVLPFVNMSPDPENEYFSDGLAEELINALTQVAGLHVTPRTSAFAFKGRSEDIRRIGEQLEVRNVLQGSVRKAGKHLRISAQLVSVKDGRHLWSQRYDRQLEDVFEIQDEIAQSIVQALRIILSDSEKRALEAVPTADVEAYDCYLRGRTFFHQFRRRGYEFAKEMFARAIEIDPSYARAYAGIADCHSMLFSYWEPVQANLDKADEASRRALELDPDLAEARVARGLAVSLRREFEVAEREFETAIQLNPKLFEAYYFFGRTFHAQGKSAEAAAVFEKASEVRREDYQAATHLVSLYSGMGREKEAESASRLAMERLVRHVELHPDDARARYLGAIVLAHSGDRKRSLEWAERALESDPEEPVTLYNVACTYAIQNELDKAIDCLGRALDRGFAHRDWIENDEDLASLHGRPEYEELLRRL